MITSKLQHKPFLLIGVMILFIAGTGVYFLGKQKDRPSIAQTSPMEWENSDDQFKQGNAPSIYNIEAKKYPQDFNECVELTKEIKDVPETSKQVLEKRKICYWESNRKYSSDLLHCPSYGKIDKQSMCGDFACEKPFYICKLEFQNSNYQEPKN